MTGVADKTAKAVHITLSMLGGQERSLDLPENSPELVALFHVLAARGSIQESSQERFFQLPLNGGQEALSFHSSQLVSIVSNPPVLLQFAQAPTAAAPLMSSIRRSKHMIIDDFLAPDEINDMLAYALKSKDKFQAGTVVTGEAHQRKNQVILHFAEAAHSTLISNRLLTWFPYIAQTLGMHLFPVQMVESQLTACNDGHYYQAHLDDGEGVIRKRELTCVYYFSKEPRQFSGGALRLYDSLIDERSVSQAQSFEQIEAVSNRLVVFPSSTFHQLMPIRCPSRKFEDSRFAVTNWIWRAETADPDASHGWGHMHCGIVPPGFEFGEVS